MNTARHQFRSRSATRQRVEDAARRHVAGGGEECDVYKVNGGYEARPVSMGAPTGSHVLLERIERPKKPAQKPPAKPAQKQQKPAGGTVQT